MKLGVNDRDMSRLLVLLADLDWEQMYVYPDPAQQETGSRSKRHPESVEGEGSRGGGT